MCSTVVPEVLTEDHVLVYVRQWHPVEFQLTPPQEVFTHQQQLPSHPFIKCVTCF
jgi:hypothetical protein